MIWPGSLVRDTKNKGHQLLISSHPQGLMTCFLNRPVTLTKSQQLLWNGSCFSDPHQPYAKLLLIGWLSLFATML